MWLVKCSVVVMRIVLMVRFMNGERLCLVVMKLKSRVIVLVSSVYGSCVFM